jgi:hypothetical protein
LGVAVLSSVSASWAQKLDVAPAIELGDRWTYKFTNLGDRRDPYTYTLQAARITPDSAWIHGETTDPNANDKKYIWRYDVKRADMLERFRWDEKAVEKVGRRTSEGLQKSDDFYRFPMEVGKKWEIKEIWSDGRGHSDWKAEIVAFEKVKTEAGEFDAFKIQYRGRWNLTTPNAQNWTGSGTAEIDRWYAPAAKRIVKSTFMDRTAGNQMWNRNITELVKWEPKAALPELAPASTAQPTQPPASAPVR